MITYVDTSVVVKLLVDEEGSARAEGIWKEAPQLVAVNLVEVEARAALAAAARSGRLAPHAHRAAKDALPLLLSAIGRINVDGALISSAADLAEAESLRGFDAVHLAGALLAADIMASADTALCAAAARQGLFVADPLDAAPGP